MSNSLAFEPLPAKAERSTTTPRRGVVAFLKAFMESLVTAQTRRFEDTQPLLYRFPPV